MFPISETKKFLRLRRLIASAAFLVIFAVLFHLVSGVLRNKRYAPYSMAFYEEPAGAVDVLLMGSSHMLNAVAPVQMWEEYGLASNNLAQVGQALPETYYALWDALRFQRPKLVVVDLYKVIQDSLIGSELSLHATLDYMPPGLPKLLAPFDLLPEEARTEYLFDFYVYHSRWKELSAADFRRPDTTEKGAQVLFKVDPRTTFQVLPATETAEPSAVEVEYLKRIVDLCAEEDIPLLLMAVPYGTPEYDDLDRQQVVNAMAAYAEEWGVPFVNMMYHLDELDFDFTTDMADEYHVNWRGMEKTTTWLGGYLTANYDLPDHRGDPAYQSWEENVSEYHAYLEANIPE